MAKTISMQDIRYLNLFERVTGVGTRFCFRYNNSIIFGVPKKLVIKSIGPNSQNLKKINYIIGKRIKVVPLPTDGSPTKKEDIKLFVEKIISPIEFKDLEVNPNEIIVKAGMQNKASLIGREKRRLYEMQKIIKEFFGKDFRIV
jgi:transcription antitermination factor NusA-like protein